MEICTAHGNGRFDLLLQKLCSGMIQSERPLVEFHVHVEYCSRESVYPGSQVREITVPTKRIDTEIQQPLSNNSARPTHTKV